jgi:hypothetical protein
MVWYKYIACFFSGMFLANAVPHFVYGICGDRFPTPFAKPPGRGLSSPTVNVLWGLFNLQWVAPCFRLEKFQAETGGRLFFSVRALLSSALDRA